MLEKIVREILINHDQAGSYFYLPFEMPVDVESLTLSYSYIRFSENSSERNDFMFTAREEVNIIDLGLIAADGSQVGASGSDKLEIFLSETHATPGYRPSPLNAGTWKIIVGAYKVASDGVLVSYEMIFKKKTSRWLRGDLHAHTIASDGVLTATELATHALRHGLDFLAITDHNQFVSAANLPEIPGITLIPGVEWTHYQGHANFLGCDKPYDSPFATNTVEEMSSIFQSAHKRGALTVINHPYDEGSGFMFDFNVLPFDCLEVWNGPMRESNLRAIGLWQHLLTTGLKVAIVGGSDYHKDGLFQILGAPTTCVYSISPSAADILAAIKAGHSYIIFAPNGPSLEMKAGEAIIGDSVSWSQCKEIEIKINGLTAKDVIRIIGAKTSDVIFESPSDGSFQMVYPIKEPGFARVEILRAFLPGLPLLPALIANPIYFDL